MRGEHVVLRARASVSDLAAVACDLERVARLIQQAGGNLPDAKTVAVVAVDNERDLRELLPQFWERRGARPLGAYWSGVYGHHIVIRVDVPAAERFRRILHEYGHFATHLTLDPPPWLDEGLSELWTHAVVESDRVEIGRPISAHIKLVSPGKHWIPVRDLVAANALPPASDRQALAHFYAESWALVHYLVFERGAGRLAFDRIPDPAAMPSDETLQRYVRRLPGATMRVPSAALVDPCGASDVRDLQPFEALIRRAHALADGERPAAALPLLREAESMTPDSPEVAETIGLVRFLQSETTEAAAVFDRLIAAGAASHVSYYYRAMLADSLPGRADGSGAVQVTEYLRRALSLDPGFEPARERLKIIEGHP